MQEAFEDPTEFLRAHLIHPAIKNLDPKEGCLYTSQNVVSNFMMDPEVKDKDGYYRPQPIPLMPLLKASYPHAEHKPRFGAGIFRFMTPLKEEQLAVSELKPDSVTHLGFTTGSGGSTGSASEEQATRFCQLFRLDMRKLGIFTNFRRFNIPNRVCTAELGFSVDLARMHAASPTTRPYWPALFPGLFFYYDHVYADRTAIHDKIIGSNRQAKRTLTIVEGDLEQIQHTLHNGPVSSEARAAAVLEATASKMNSTELTREEMQAVEEALNIYLPLREKLVILVFRLGKMVGLGIKNLQLGQEAFRVVAEVAKQFILTKEQALEADLVGTAGSGKKRKSQARLNEKTKALNEAYINMRKPLSTEALKKLDEITATVADPERRNEQIKNLIMEEADRKKKKKRKTKGAGGGAGEDFDDDVQEAIEAANAGPGDNHDELIDVQAEIDAALLEEEEEDNRAQQSANAQTDDQAQPADIADFLLNSAASARALWR